MQYSDWLPIFTIIKVVWLIYYKFLRGKDLDQKARKWCKNKWKYVKDRGKHFNLKSRWEKMMNKKVY